MNLGTVSIAAGLRVSLRSPSTKDPLQVSAPLWNGVSKRRAPAVQAAHAVEGGEHPPQGQGRKGGGRPHGDKPHAAAVLEQDVDAEHEDDDGDVLLDGEEEGDAG